MRSTVSAKGQITIPIAVRRQLGLVAGTPVEIELCDQGVLLRKGISGEHPVDRAYGVLQLDSSVDDLIDEMRGKRQEELEDRS